MGDAAEKMDSDTNLMDDLAKAWDEAEEETQDVEDQQQDDTEEPGPVDDTVSGPEEQPDGEEEPPVVSDDQGEVPQAAIGEDGKPPVGLSPAAREAWGDVPDVVKTEIEKREKDYEAGIMKYAENAKRAEGMDQVLQPYQQLFAMNGGIGQTMPGLLQTASLLQMGSPAQKAQTVATLIQQFGIDIQALDSLLVGEQPQQTQQAPNVEQMVDQRMAQYQQQQQQVVQERTNTEVQGEIQAFAADTKNEFYNDVKMDMADLMDMAANRGNSLSLADAYSKACAMHPQISQIMASRANGQSTREKQAAAASIAGSPGGPGDPASPSSMRDQLEDAWNQAGRT